MGSQLVELILARELGEMNIITDSISQATLNKIYPREIRPGRNFKYAIIHGISLAIPLPCSVGRARAFVGSLATSATTYGNVATWTVATGFNGELVEISVDSTNLAKTNWRLSVAGNEEFTGFASVNGFDLLFTKNQLGDGVTVQLQAASTDGTAITAYGIITGRQFFHYMFEISLRKGNNVSPQTFYATDEVIRNGIPLWAYINQGDPLYMDVQNTKGLGNESFLAQYYVINVPSQAHLEEIKRLVRALNIAPEIPFIPQPPIRFPILVR